MAESLPKKAWKGKWDSGRKFKPEWEKKYPWVGRAPNDHDSAFCKMCKKVIIPKVWNLTEHEKSQGHKAQVSHGQRSVKSMFVPKKDVPGAGVKTAEIRLAAAMACHCSIRSVDHISEILKVHGKGSDLGEIKLHRTKTSKLILSAILQDLNKNCWRTCLI